MRQLMQKYFQAAEKEGVCLYCYIEDRMDPELISICEAFKLGFDSCWKLFNTPLMGESNQEE